MHQVPGPYTDPAPLFRHGGAPVTDRGPLLDFSVNINPLGPPGSVLHVLRQELPAIARYPDPDCRTLREKLAAAHGVEPDQVVIGNGSNELIHAIPRAVRPRRVAIAEPTYTEYLHASLLVGAEVVHWLAEGSDFDFEPFDPAGADLVWLCNPNNPTGGLWPGERLRTWIRSQPQTLFVVDEAFLSFLDEEPEHSLIPMLRGGCSNLLVLRSLTKLYALPGLRLGYGVASADLAARLREQLVPWSVNVLAQAAGVVLLGDRGFVARSRMWLSAQSAGLAQDLQEGFAGRLVVVPSRAHFLLLRLIDCTAATLINRLVARGIMVRDAGNFVGLDEHYIRVAARSVPDNERLLAALRASLQEEG